MKYHYEGATDDACRQACGSVLRGAGDWDGGRTKPDLSLSEEEESNEEGLDIEGEETTLDNINTNGIWNKRAKLCSGLLQIEVLPSLPPIAAEESAFEAENGDIESDS